MPKEKRPKADNGHMFMRVHFALINGPFSEMTDGMIKTLLAIGYFADENGECFPTRSTLGEILGISENAVKSRIKQLKEFRYKNEPIIEVINRYKEGGTNTSNLYRINRKYLSLFEEPTKK